MKRNANTNRVVYLKRVKCESDESENTWRNSVDS
jgi:hypothetical protein